MIDPLDVAVSYSLLKGAELADYLLLHEAYFRLVADRTREQLIDAIEKKQIDYRALPKIVSKDPGLKKYVPEPKKNDVVREIIEPCSLVPDGFDSIRLVVVRPSYVSTDDV